MTQEPKQEDELKIEPIDNKLAPKFYKGMKIALLNAAVITSAGSYMAIPIPLETARLIANSASLESHIGHESTAKLLSKILEVPILFCRDELKQQIGQLALVCKLKQRAPEGTVLNERQLKEIGLEFWLLYRSA